MADLDLNELQYCEWCRIAEQVDNGTGNKTLIIERQQGPGNGHYFVNWQRLTRAPGAYFKDDFPLKEFSFGYKVKWPAGLLNFRTLYIPHKDNK